MLVPKNYIIMLNFILFTVLFLSVVLFTVTAIFILTDNRRHLVSSIQLYHPSFLYAYIAIPTQAGVVQVSPMLCLK